MHEYVESKLNVSMNAKYFRLLIRCFVSFITVQSYDVRK